MLNRVICNGCGYDSTAENFRELELNVLEEGGYLGINFRAGEIIAFECPHCGSEDADLEF